MKYLYKYPQGEFPYRDLVETNRRLSREQFEHELLDTVNAYADQQIVRTLFGIFHKYVEIPVVIETHRGPEAARLRLLPTLWYRNTWSWKEDHPRPMLREAAPGLIHATHPDLGQYWLYCEKAPELLFTENESNARRLWRQPNASAYVKDAFHAYVVSHDREAVNPAHVGTKAAAH
jgi:hypothetical protein